MRTPSFGSWGSYTLLSETFLRGNQLHGAPMGTCRCFLSYYRVGQQIFHPVLSLGRCSTGVPQGPKLQVVARADPVAQPLPLAPSAEGLRLMFAHCRTKYSQLGQEHRCSPGVLVTQPGSRHAQNWSLHRTWEEVISPGKCCKSRTQP